MNIQSLSNAAVAANNVPALEALYAYPGALTAIRKASELLDRGEQGRLPLEIQSSAHHMNDKIMNIETVEMSEHKKSGLEVTAIESTDCGAQWAICEEGRIITIGTFDDMLKLSAAVSKIEQTDM